jgi:hypothetical protein
VPGRIRLIIVDPAAEMVVNQVLADQPDLRSRMTLVRLDPSR